MASSVLACKITLLGKGNVKLSFVGSKVSSQVRRKISTSIEEHRMEAVEIKLALCLHQFER